MQTKARGMETWKTLIKNTRWILPFFSTPFFSGILRLQNQAKSRRERKRATWVSRNPKWSEKGHEEVKQWRPHHTAAVQVMEEITLFTITGKLDRGGWIATVVFDWRDAEELMGYSQNYGLFANYLNVMGWQLPHAIKKEGMLVCINYLLTKFTWKYE